MQRTIPRSFGIVPTHDAAEMWAYRGHLLRHSAYSASGDRRKPFPYDLAMAVGTRVLARESIEQRLYPAARQVNSHFSIDPNSMGHSRYLIPIPRRIDCRPLRSGTEDARDQCQRGSDRLAIPHFA